MNFNDLCVCMCSCESRQAFWDKLSRQLARYRYCANGDCTEDGIGMPGNRGEAMSPEAFAMMGFMLMPMMFVMFGLMQRLGRRRQITEGSGKAPGPESNRRDEGPPPPPVD
uniref:Small integral membrane protein 14 n=1 Tax=Hemiselmis andersenii TaxID=464988 RepID=A0A6T8P5E9_HEMAN|mmetsp:Transcript_29071/g.68014  ORF Transcript_29071/g.68014 Transcript_29071/m.68014 type:complete len:111 (+) Transcript_29071:96-428(+)